MNLPMAGIFKVLLTLMILCGICIGQFAFAGEYEITDLGMLDGHIKSEAYDINDYGQVVGISYERVGYPGPVYKGHAFLWDNGTMTDLGTLGGDESFAYGINDDGQVVGGAITAGSSIQHAFLWDSRTITDLGTLGGPESYAVAINNLGQIAGTSNIEEGNYGHIHPFLWDSGTMTDLGDIDGVTHGTWAGDVNDSAQVVGVGGIENRNHGFLWETATMTNISSLSDSISSGAYGINNCGEVVGYVYDEIGGSVMQRVFLLEDDGSMTYLDVPGGRGGSDAYDINDFSEVVGTFVVANGEDWEDHAFLWENGTMTDLTELLNLESCWASFYPKAINNAGQIVGYANMVGQDSQHAILLTPTGIIPEPSSVFLFTSGLLGYFWIGRCKKRKI